jgi:hypothetical protein
MTHWITVFPWKRAKVAQKVALMNPLSLVSLLQLGLSFFNRSSAEQSAVANVEQIVVNYAPVAVALFSGEATVTLPQQIHTGTHLYAVTFTKVS